MNTNCCCNNRPTTCCGNNRPTTCCSGNRFKNHNDKHDHKRDEICVDGVLYKFKLNEVSEGVSELVVVPCKQPTLILCVAEIRKKENCCMNMTYFQATINTHCVEIIQECSLEKIIESAIRIFIANSELLCAGRSSSRGRGLGFRGFVF